MADTTDRVLRGMTDDGSFRVIAVTTTHTVRGVIAAQSAVGKAARWLGDLVTGTILVRETMAPALRVQGILRNRNGSGMLIADAHPDGSTRWLLQWPPGSEIEAGPGALLQMIRTMPSGALHRGVVEVPATGGISAAFMAYMQVSEQVVSMIAVGAVTEGETVLSSGGYIVQLLPELGEAQLAIMTERLDDFAPIEALLARPETTPETLMDELLDGWAYTVLASSGLEFRCGCSEDRVLAGIATLPREEVEGLVADGTAVEVQCDYCQREYRVESPRLLGLLARS